MCQVVLSGSSFNYGGDDNTYNLPEGVGAIRNDEHIIVSDKTDSLEVNVGCDRTGGGIVILLIDKVSGDICDIICDNKVNNICTHTMGKDQHGNNLSCIIKN